MEIEGGEWMRGRHNRGGGFIEDCRKYNAAVVRGWRVLRYTSTDMTQRPFQCIEEVRNLLESLR